MTSTPRTRCSAKSERYAASSLTLWPLLQTMTPRPVARAARLGAAGDVHEERVAHVEHEQGHDPALAGPQLAGGLAADVAELLDHRLHTVPGRLGDQIGPVDHIGHRAHGDAGLAGHVLDSDHTHHVLLRGFPRPPVRNVLKGPVIAPIETVQSVRRTTMTINPAPLPARSHSGAVLLVRGPSPAREDDGDRRRRWQALVSTGEPRPSIGGRGTTREARGGRWAYGRRPVGRWPWPGRPGAAVDPGQRGPGGRHVRDLHCGLRGLVGGDRRRTRPRCAAAAGGLGPGAQRPQADSAPVRSGRRRAGASRGADAQARPLRATGATRQLPRPGRAAGARHRPRA